jgi:hypothetical protein
MNTSPSWDPAEFAPEGPATLRCSNHHCAALMAVDDDDLVAQRNYQLNEGIYLDIRWTCPHCERPTVLDIEVGYPWLPLDWQIDDIARHQGFYKPDDPLPVSRSALITALTTWVTSDEYRAGDPDEDNWFMVEQEAISRGIDVDLLNTLHEANPQAGTDALVRAALGLASL